MWKNHVTDKYERMLIDALEHEPEFINSIAPLGFNPYAELKHDSLEAFWIKTHVQHLNILERTFNGASLHDFRTVKNYGKKVINKINNQIVRAMIEGRKRTDLQISAELVVVDAVSKMLIANDIPTEVFNAAPGVYAIVMTLDAVNDSPPEPELSPRPVTSNPFREYFENSGREIDE